MKEKRIINEMKLRLPALGANEGVARTCISAFAAELDPTVEELCDLRCAISEAVTNAVVHAYRDTEDRKNAFIYISARLYTGREITVEISDRGCGIDDPERAMGIGFTTGDAAERCGMGFLVMRSFTDSLKLKTAKGKGTSVLMRKIFKAGESE